MTRCPVSGQPVASSSRGAAGFLGRRVVAKLEDLEADVVVPRSAEYDLTVPGAAEALIADHRPTTIVHLAARVGGIGYNQAEPAPLYLANLLMGTHVIEAARHDPGVEKTVLLGTVCSYPKFTPVPFREESLWDGYPEETNAPYGLAKKAHLDPRPGQRRPVRAALRVPHPDQPLRARRQVPSRACRTSSRP